MSVPVAGESVTIRDNYIKQNAFNGIWGQADSSGKVRGSYGIEAPQAPSGQPGGIVEGNTIISERNVMGVSAPGKDTIVRNNKFYGTYAWGVAGGEPGALGYGSVAQSDNVHDSNHRKGPDVPRWRPDRSSIRNPGRDPKNRTVQSLNSTSRPAPAPTPASVPVNSTYVSDLDWASATNGVGAPERDQSNGGSDSNDGGPIRLNNSAYDKGIGVASDSAIVYQLDGQFTKLFSDIGIDDAVQHKGQLSFVVFADGKKIYNSGVVRGSDATKSVQLDVAGVNELKLVTTSGKNSTGQYDRGDWANARLV
jgi:hypothetical protein